MDNLTCLIGLDPPETTLLAKQIDAPVMIHPTMPVVQVRGGELFVQKPNAMAFARVTRVIYHGIFEDDLDLIAALTLWDGPCLPNARGMLDCRLKLPGLARAMAVSKFATPRGYAAPQSVYPADREMVAKWGNWHCGENKQRFNADFLAEQHTIVEPYFDGLAVRLMVMGDRAWQIGLEGSGWLKSIHAEDAAFMPIDPMLHEDTRAIGSAFGLEMLANDYIVAHDGSKHLLEVNHIPNVTRFEEIRDAFITFAANWANAQ